MSSAPPTPPVMLRMREKASPEARPRPSSSSTRAVMPTNMAAVSIVWVKKFRFSLFMFATMRTKLYLRASKKLLSLQTKIWIKYSIKRWSDLMMTKLTGMYRIRCVTTMICGHTYIRLTIAIVSKNNDQFLRGRNRIPGWENCQESCPIM